jgi:hypothetical protein
MLTRLQLEDTQMAHRSESLRGLVISNWEKSGQPLWDVTQTVEMTEDADAVLEEHGLRPAPRFRVERQLENPVYVKQWVMGCHFPWLNPR